jgi:hypothetical protein
MFDVRLIIALLMGVYGLVLTILGIGFTTDEQIARSAGVNINLWAGLGMLALAAAFVAWARLRPLELPPADDDGPPGPRP